jgi:hypothetical protein
MHTAKSRCVRVLRSPLRILHRALMHSRHCMLLAGAPSFRLSPLYLYRVPSTTLPPAISQHDRDAETEERASRRKAPRGLGCHICRTLALALAYTFFAGPTAPGTRQPPSVAGLFSERIKPAHQEALVEVNRPGEGEGGLWLCVHLI